MPSFIRSILFRVVGVILAFLLAVEPTAMASPMPQMPAPGRMVSLSAPGTAPFLLGIKYSPQDPLQLQFLMENSGGSMTASSLPDESLKLVHYFLTAMTLPAKDLWVNLSPYENSRIAEQHFAKTEMGRDLLAVDYILKQVTASALHPDSATGAAFWKKVYKTAQARLGTTDIPLDAFNKVWIVPAEAELWEDGGKVVILNSRLKVLLEEDYVAMSSQQLPTRGHVVPAGDYVSSHAALLREILIPVLEKEVNEGRQFAALRQIYRAVILAAWYKKRLRQAALNGIYTDRHKISGLRHQERGVIAKIYRQYAASFKKGAFNFIREEEDPSTRELIVRHHFSGGVSWENIDRAMTIRSGLGQKLKKQGAVFLLTVSLLALMPGTASAAASPQGKAAGQWEKMSPVQINAKLQDSLKLNHNDRFMRDYLKEYITAAAEGKVLLPRVGVSVETEALLNKIVRSEKAETPLKAGAKRLLEDPKLMEAWHQNLRGLMGFSNNDLNTMLRMVLSVDEMTVVKTLEWALTSFTDKELAAVSDSRATEKTWQAHLARLSADHYVRRALAHPETLVPLARYYASLVKQFEERRAMLAILRLKEDTLEKSAVEGFLKAFRGVDMYRGYPQTKAFQTVMIKDILSKADAVSPSLRGTVYSAAVGLLSLETGKEAGKDNNTARYEADAILAPLREAMIPYGYYIAIDAFRNEAPSMSLFKILKTELVSIDGRSVPEMTCDVVFGSNPPSHYRPGEDAIVIIPENDVRDAQAALDDRKQPGRYPSYMVKLVAGYKNLGALTKEEAGRTKVHERAHAQATAKWKYVGDPNFGLSSSKELDPVLRNSIILELEAAVAEISNPKHLAMAVYDFNKILLQPSSSKPHFYAMGYLYSKILRMKDKRSWFDSGKIGSMVRMISEMPPAQLVKEAQRVKQELFDNTDKAQALGGVDLNTDNLDVKITSAQNTSDALSTPKPLAVDPDHIGGFMPILTGFMPSDVAGFMN